MPYTIPNTYFPFNLTYSTSGPKSLRLTTSLLVNTNCSLGQETMLYLFVHPRSKSAFYVNLRKRRDGITRLNRLTLHHLPSFAWPVHRVETEQAYTLVSHEDNPYTLYRRSVSHNPPYQLHGAGEPVLRIPGSNQVLVGDKKVVDTLTRRKLGAGRRDHDEEVLAGFGRRMMGRVVVDVWGLSSLMLEVDYFV